MESDPDQPTGVPSVRVAALAALFQAEITANIGVLQATTAISLGVLAYLGATIAFLPTVNTDYILFLPAPLLASSTFQMLQAAVVMRRAQSAKVYEIELAKIAQFDREVRDREIGSGYYGIDDLNVINATGGKLRFLKMFIAAISYLGMYALAVGYTVLLITLYDHKTDHSHAGLVWAAIVYGVLWVLFLVVALGMFRPSRGSPTIEKYAFGGTPAAGGGPDR